mmetsp:Transcript_47198/g.117775  ORF Transcript_47198/g.117775 Transcript_47198/m.117775 type:complete len:99 (+) Transcript_47198:363-659(+)
MGRSPSHARHSFITLRHSFSSLSVSRPQPPGRPPRVSVLKVAVQLSIVRHLRDSGMHQQGFAAIGRWSGFLRPLLLLLLLVLPLLVLHLHQVDRAAAV